MFSGEKLRELREKQGLKQYQLARKAKLNINHISQLESGYRMPSWKTACKLADALKVSLDDFRK